MDELFALIVAGLLGLAAFAVAVLALVIGTVYLLAWACARMYSFARE